MISSASDAGEEGLTHRYATAPDKRVSVTIVEAISAAANTTVEQLPVLYEVIDPDALDTLFATRPDGTSPFDGQVSFVYAGFRVVVGNGSVTVRPIAG